jgi:hypothetical protein
MTWIDPRILPVLRRYAAGRVSAYDAACDIQDLRIPGYEDPSASEVVLWARQTGIGIPAPTEEEAQAEADAILRRMRGGEPGRGPSEGGGDGAT